MSRPKILVVGLRPDKQQQLRARCQEVADLTFATVDGRKVRVPAGADHCVFVTCFTNHMWQDEVLRLYRGRTHFRRGPTHAVRAVLDIASNPRITPSR
jgi:hypothetical protein